MRKERVEVEEMKTKEEILKRIKFFENKLLCTQISQYEDTENIAAIDALKWVLKDD